MKKWQVTLGIFLIVMGLFTIIRLFFDIDLWNYVLPLILIGVGIFVILRPSFIEKNKPQMMRIFGDIRRVGEREVINAEYWLLAGDVKLDYASSVVPEGQTEIKIFLGFGDIRLTVPTEVGVKIRCESMISEIHSEKRTEEHIFQSSSYESPDFAFKTQKLCFQTSGIVNVVKLDQLNQTN